MFVFRPKNTELDAFKLDEWRWQKIMESGVGAIFLHGPSIIPGDYHCVLRDSKDPMSHEGFKVTEEEAKIAAKVLNGLIYIEKQNIELYHCQDLNTQKMIDNYTYCDIDLNRLMQKARFVDWLNLSGGFEIW